MVTPSILRLAPRLVAPRSIKVPRKSFAQCSASLPCLVTRRAYASPSGVKEVAVRDALNEALTEELEANDKVFVLGEEVAQYNGA